MAISAKTDKTQNPPHVINLECEHVTQRSIIDEIEDNVHVAVVFVLVRQETLLDQLVALQLRNPLKGYFIKQIVDLNSK